MWRGNLFSRVCLSVFGNPWPRKFIFWSAEYQFSECWGQVCNMKVIGWRLKGSLVLWRWWWWWWLLLLLGLPADMSEGLKLHWWTFFLFYHTVLSIRTVDGHQMYFGGFVVGKASLIEREISPTPSLIFKGGQKVRNLASFSTSLNFEPPCSKITELSQNWWAAMIASCPSQIWWSWVHAPWEAENHPVKVPHPLKLHGENVLNRE